MSAATRERAPLDTATGSRGLQAWHVLGAAVALTMVLVGAYSFHDPDVFWHRILGHQWIDTHSFGLSPDPIAYTSGRAWATTAWLPEVVYAALVGQFGYGSLLALRFVLASAFAAALTWTLWSQRTPWAGTLALATVGLPAALTMQDRPQTFSLVLTAVMLPWVRRFLLDDTLPGPVAVLAFTWLWANIHGLWVLVPGLLAVAAICRGIDRRSSWHRPTALLIATVAIAAITPIGPRLLLSPFRVAGATQQIAEWQPTNIFSAESWGLGLMVALLLVMWARSSHPVPSRQIVFLVCWGLFGVLASRNAIFASLLLAPLLLHCLESAFTGTVSTIRVPRTVLYVVMAVGLPLVGIEYSHQTWRPDDSPVRIAQHLHDEQRDIRLVNPYNVAGYLREFGGDRVRLAIDGRADRYGGAYIRDYSRMMLAQGNWQRLFTQLRPDAVVVDRDSPLVPLIEQRGWHRVMTSNGWVLLEKS